jgi:CubicO group peptidase (beta-lactamase class C family)
MTAVQLTGVSSALEEILQDGAAQRVYPGAAWAVGDVGGIQLCGVTGLLDPTDPARPVTTDTVFDIASLTKIMAVWASIGALWETGQLALDATLASLIPARTAGYPLGQITVRQLLTHTAGVPLRANLQALYGTDPASIHDGVLRESLHRPPGEAVEYTDRAALILGYLLEDLTATPLDTFSRDRIWAPLGMYHTRFGPLPDDQAAHCAPTELEPSAGRHLRGTAHDYSARLLGGVCGVAGAFSTIGDCGLFLRHMLNPAATPTAAGFGSAWVRESLRLHTADLDPSRGLFWYPAPDTSPADDIWVHYGFTGTGLWISPQRQRWGVLLTNKLYYTRDREPIGRIRDAFRQTIFS